MEIFGYRKLIAYQKAKEVVNITTNDRLNMDQLIEETARLLSGLLNSYKPSDSKL